MTGSRFTQRYPKITRLSSSHLLSLVLLTTESVLYFPYETHSQDLPVIENLSIPFLYTYTKKCNAAMSLKNMAGLYGTLLRGTTRRSLTRFVLGGIPTQNICMYHHLPVRGSRGDSPLTPMILHGPPARVHMGREISREERAGCNAVADSPIACAGFGDFAHGYRLPSCVRRLIKKFVPYFGNFDIN